MPIAVDKAAGMQNLSYSWPGAGLDYRREDYMKIEKRVKKSGRLPQRSIIE